MIEWGTGTNTVNQTSSNYYWLWSTSNNTVSVNGSSIAVILPAVSIPRMVSLNIQKSSLNHPQNTTVYFYMNQSGLVLTNNLYSENMSGFDFQGNKGLNILNWEYSGSLHATTDPANTLTGAIVTVRTATKVYL